MLMRGMIIMLIALFHLHLCSMVSMPMIHVKHMNLWMQR